MKQLKELKVYLNIIEIHLKRAEMYRRLRDADDHGLFELFRMNYHRDMMREIHSAENFANYFIYLLNLKKKEL